MRHVYRQPFHGLSLGIASGGAGGFAYILNMRSNLKLRPVGLGDEESALAAHQTMMESDGFEFLLNYDQGMPWADYVRRLQDHRRGVNLPDGLVPAFFLLAVVDGVIVGRSSIRLGLNDWLAHQGGHIGYGVLPEHRRQGFATAILRQSVSIARSEGVDPSLVCCDDTNAGSAAVIERCGGVLENVVDGDDGPTRRYWVS